MRKNVMNELIFFPWARYFIFWGHNATNAFKSLSGFGLKGGSINTSVNHG
jgi:hypothetical protein